MNDSNERQMHSGDKMGNNHVRTGEAAKMLGVHRQTVLVYVRSGDLDAYSIPTNRLSGTREYRISVKSIERFIEARKQ